MIELSCKELIINGKSIVFYKTGLMPAKKCLVPVCNFEKAITFERLLKQAIQWKKFNFTIEKVIESWDKFYYKLSLNGDFLITCTNKMDAEEIAHSIMKKLNIKNYAVQQSSF